MVYTCRPFRSTISGPRICRIDPYLLIERIARIRRSPSDGFDLSQTQCTDIFIPVLMDGAKSEVVLEGNASPADVNLYWHMDGRYIGMTKGMHRLSASPPLGRHTLTLVDESGETINRTLMSFRTNRGH